MKQVQLTIKDKIQANDYVVLVADKASVSSLSEYLEPQEAVYANVACEKQIPFFFFPRAEAGVFVHFLKKEKEDNDLDSETVRLAGNTMLSQLRHYKIERVTLVNCCTSNQILAYSEGMALGSYQFQKYISKPEKKPETNLQEIEIHQNSANEGDVFELNALIESVFLARDLVNQPHSHLDTPAFGRAIKQIAEDYHFDADILEKHQIESLRMGGLLAVNKASKTPPEFCILEYKPETPALNAKPIVLVGKGVVYDTGGISLKHADGLDYMKCDMAGAAAVVGVMATAAKTKMPLHIIGLIPITDNKIGERAILPGDVIQMYSGTTVEVVNTDAEGRLILADALHHAKRYEPELALDIATLTGSAVKALGNQAICYMGTASKQVKENLEASGIETYERLVELPLWKEYGEELKSNVADLKNLGSSNAGMITAGKFLEHFTDYPWLHLDIAGPAYLRTANGYRTKEGTGVGIRLIYNFLKKYYCSK